MSPMLRALAALAVITFAAGGQQARAADITLSQDNPFAQGCPFERVTLADRDLYLNLRVDFHSAWFLPECPYQGAGDWSVRAAGGTQHPAQDMLDSWRWMFISETGRPRLGLAASWTLDFNHSIAVGHSLIRAPVIRLDGEIRPGDADRLASLLRDEVAIPCLAAGYCPFSAVLSLESPGGSLDEALQLARLVREYQLITYLPEASSCNSACVFVFLAGYTDYENLFHIRRFAHDGAQLGIHRPSIDLDQPSYTGQTVERIIELMDEVKAEAVRQFVNARMPLALLEQMYATPPDRMYTLSPAELSMVAHVLGERPLRQMPDREGILSLCANRQFQIEGVYQPRLLTTLDIRADSFITHDPNGGFACYGARMSDNQWIYEVCSERLAPEICALQRCLSYLPNEPGADCRRGLEERFAHYIENGFPLGHELDNLAGGALHGAFTRLLATGHQRSRYTTVPAWAGTPQRTPAYCGRIDLRAPETATAVQTALNARGFNVGRADGRIGPRSQAALADARQRLAPGLGTDDPAFLRALGLSDTQIREATLCD